MTTKTIARWITIGALFLIPFLGLYISNSMYFPFITGKNFAFRTLVEIAFAGWVVLAFPIDDIDRDSPGRRSGTSRSFLDGHRRSVLCRECAQGILEQLRTHGWRHHAHSSIRTPYRHGCRTLDRESLAKVVAAFIAGNALVCAYGLAQLIGIHGHSPRLDAYRRIHRERGIFRWLSSLRYCSDRMAGARDACEELAWLRYSLFALAVVQFILLFETGTRGTLIGLVAASFLWQRALDH
jgi:hypothetical protein